MTEEVKGAVAAIFALFLIILCVMAGMLGHSYWHHTVTFEGEVSNIYSYHSEGKGLKDDRDYIWRIYINNDAEQFKAHPDTKPYRINIGDYVVAECWYNRGNLAKRITVNGSGEY